MCQIFNVFFAIMSGYNEIFRVELRQTMGISVLELSVIGSTSVTNRYLIADSIALSNSIFTCLLVSKKLSGDKSC
jgi:hypothetical protein